MHFERKTSNKCFHSWFFLGLEIKISQEWNYWILPCLNVLGDLDIFASIATDFRYPSQLNAKLFLNKIKPHSLQCDLENLHALFDISKRPSLSYNTSPRHKRHECDKNTTRTARMRHECNTNDTSATRVKNFDFYNETSENIFPHPILALWQTKDYKERNSIIVRRDSSPCQSTFEKCNAKTELCNPKSYIQNL